MRVVPASFEILTDLDQQSMATRIEACGRICYKSEDKITEQSAGPFITNILKRKHNSVAEMAVLTLKVTLDDPEKVSELYSCIPKYFSVDQLDDALLLTGSVRAFRELYIFNPQVDLVQAITVYLSGRHPLFFKDLVPEQGWPQADNGVRAEKISLEQVEKLEPKLLARHRHLAVKFITNRAVTHEIVRHRPCAYLQESQRYCRYDKEQFGNEVTFIKPMFFAEGSPEYALWEKAMADTESIYLDLLKTSSPQAARTVLPNSCKTEIVVYTSLDQWHHIFKLRTPGAAEPSMREVMIPLLAEFNTMYPAIFSDLTE